MHPLSLSGRKIKHNWVSLFCCVLQVFAHSSGVIHHEEVEPKYWNEAQVCCLIRKSGFDRKWSVPCNAMFESTFNICIIHLLKLKLKWNSSEILQLNVMLRAFIVVVTAKVRAKCKIANVFIWQDLGLGIWFNFNSWGIN